MKAMSKQQLADAAGVSVKVLIAEKFCIDVE